MDRTSLLRSLCYLGEMNIREKMLCGSVGNEFYMTLSCDSSGCDVDRLSFARRELAEHATIARGTLD